MDITIGYERWLVIASSAMIAALSLTACFPQFASTTEEAPTRAVAPEKPSAPELASASTPPRPEQITRPLAVSDERHRCNTDRDCIASCAHGAVNTSWLSRNYPGGELCEDGCTSKGTDPPKCEANSCVAYRFGAPDPPCTNTNNPIDHSPGWAHRCKSDNDCTVTCAYGAVNAAWLSSLTEPADCKGGCTAKGWAPPKCQEGMCVAYFGDKRAEDCTGREVLNER